MKCVQCEEKDCYRKGKKCHNLTATCEEEYDKVNNRDVLTVASKLEAEFYCQLTRIEELIKFCQAMNYKKIGLAFCIGLSQEAKVISDILEKKFQVASVCCKNGSMSKEQFSVPKLEKTKEEAMCNPIGQGLVLNREKTDLNVIVGLCIGHDILFNKYSEAPTTTLIVKDRVLAHNPIGAVYCGYYRKF